MDNRNAKRALSLVLSLLMVVSSINFSLVANAADANAARIVGFNALEEDLAVQELPVGASIDDVKFPSTLKATVEFVEEVEVQKAVEEEPKEGEPVEEEPAEAEPADPAEEEAATEPAETVDDTDEAVQEPESDTEAESNETPAEQKEATPEEPASTEKDSESVDTSFIDIIFPAIVGQAEEAEEEPVDEPTEETEKKAVQKEVIVEVTEWKTTDGKAFDSSTEASFVYEPVLKTDYPVATALPTIKVNIVNTKSKAAFEKSQVVDGVRITVKADAGVFPEGATLSVAKVSGSEEQAVEAAVDEKRDDNKNKVEAYTFDIKVLDKDGNEIEPDNSKGKVKVSFTLEEVANENLETDVYHIKGEVGSLSVDELNAEEVGDTTVEATTDGFSYYTVEFTYNNLQYVMNGDTTVALSEILDSVGLSGNIEAVVSSNPELFKVENNGSAWQVTAVQAFHSDETLTVTLDGVEYVITVTDVEFYDLWVGGTQVTSENKNNIPAAVAENKTAGTASFNPDTYTLTLDGYTYEGDCATGTTGDENKHAVVYAKKLPYFNLEIKGTVSITQTDATTIDSVCGLYLWCQNGTNEISIIGIGDNPKLIAIAGKTKSGSYSPNAGLYYSAGSCAIQECTIEARSIDTQNGKGSFGIFGSPGPTITNCTINAYGGNNSTSSGGINIGDSSAMKIQNSTVVATSAATSNSYGIKSNYGMLHIYNPSDVTLRGYSAATTSTIYFHDISGMCYDNYDMLGDPTIVTQYSSPPPPKEPAKAIRAVPHTHSFTYAASGDTITATCSANGCSLTDSKVTLKIVKPTLSVEGGAGNAAATLEGLTGYNAATGLSLAESNIEYATAGSSNYSSTAPTTKGAYVARITAGTVTALVSYEIGNPPKAAPSADVARTAAQISYINEAVTPDGVEISSSDETYVPVTSLTSVLDESSTPKIYVRYPADDDYGPSAWVEVALTPRPSAPGGISIVNASSDTAQDGMIDGTTTAMEYKEAGDSSYRPASDGSTLVAPGTYMVRTKAADDTPASVPFQVVIQAKTNQEPPSTSGISVINTTGNDSNGKISGLAAGMEYSVDGGNTWQTVVGTELNNIQAGEYLI